MTAYRQANDKDDLSSAIYRDTVNGPEPWVPMEPLGWQDERPRWLQWVVARLEKLR